MDNIKIGKFIAELRNAKGLTQQELGDKIGVGFRAVSKWECGQTLPDISNMKELSKILGITLDELIAGKRKTKNNKLSKKSKIIIAISSIITLVLIITTILIPKQDKSYVYNLNSVDKHQYTIEGQITFKQENITIAINKLSFLDKNLESTKITNYEYRLISNNQQLIGFGYSPTAETNKDLYTIKTFSENFIINSTIETNLTQKDILENNMYLIIDFIDENNQLINHQIEIALS